MVNRRHHAACSPVFALALLWLVSHGCSRADLYAITRVTSDAGEPNSSGPSSSLAPSSSVSPSSTLTTNPSAGASTDASAAPSNAVPSSAPSPTPSTLPTPSTEPADAGPTATCSVAAPEPGDSTHSIVVDGAERSYVLHIPPGHNASAHAPLVVDFHGVGDSGEVQRQTSPYPAALDPLGVVMAFPDGLRGPAGTAWNVGPCCVADVDDVAFARALVADVQTRACIDVSRVYAVGILTGGGMSHHLACHAADVFAAVAPAAFDLLEENVDECEPTRPISVVSFRGTADSRVPFEGGPSSLVPGMPLTFLGAQATFETWATLNDCTSAPSPADANGCSSYAGCAGGVDVVLCTQQDAAIEPGDPAIAWPLLSRHSL